MGRPRYGPRPFSWTRFPLSAPTPGTRSTSAPVRLPRAGAEMRIWIDLANSPHVRLFEPLIRSFREKGWDTILTARDHAQTLELARERWDDVTLIGGPSPSGRAAKGRAILGRAYELGR